MRVKHGGHIAPRADVLRPFSRSWTNFQNKQLCPEARTEATMEGFEDEVGHVRIYPPAGMREKDIEEIEGRTADRCVDILVAKGVFICSAVYD